MDFKFRIIHDCDSIWTNRVARCLRNAGREWLGLNGQVQAEITDRCGFGLQVTNGLLIDWLACFGGVAVHPLEPCQRLVDDFVGLCAAIQACAVAIYRC